MRRGARPEVVALAALLLAAGVAVVVLIATANEGSSALVPTPTPVPVVQTPNLGPAAAYASHVDATFYTLSAIFEDAEGGSLEQFAGDSTFARDEELWIDAQPRLPCLTAAANQWARAIAALKAAMDTSVRAYQSDDATALASLSAKTDPVRSTLLTAKQAVDEAAARC
ncbi:MAG TPA: hypothetical protein VKR24_12755 [Candidatus Limnocylindrales bacterium]|nr:hypothetical protein [Candidatus Limnocylindrales bacterium]